MLVFLETRWSWDHAQQSTRTDIWSWKEGFGRLTLTFQDGLLVAKYLGAFYFLGTRGGRLDEGVGCMDLTSRCSTGWIICPGLSSDNPFRPSMNSLQNC